jgi:DNA-binding MarR family transcriptional regulator
VILLYQKASAEQNNTGKPPLIGDSLPVGSQLLISKYSSYQQRKTILFIQCYYLFLPFSSFYLKIKPEFLAVSVKPTYFENSCITNYMPNNQFKRGELYSVINGMASTAVARRLQKNFRQAGLEITIEQWSVLYHLWKEDCLSQQELCNRTFRDKPSITRLIDNLEKQKLVRRMASKTDRRINLVCLTQAAVEMQEMTILIANQTMDEALEGISREEINVVKSVFQRVYDNLTVGILV